MTTVVPETRPLAFTRQLGGLEHLFSLIDRNRAIHFTMAAQFEGPTSIPAWRAALDKLQERHPLLSVAIEFNNASVPSSEPLGTPRFHSGLSSGRRFGRRRLHASCQLPSTHRELRWLAQC